MKKVLITLGVTALCSFTLFAQTGERYVVRTAEKPQIRVPATEAPAALIKIYSNLGKKTDVYNCCGGFVIWGPTVGGGGSEQFLAMPFTPKSNSTVKQVQAAIQYSSGDNQINLSLYNDVNGAPGTLLAGPVTVTNLPGAWTCCTLAVANFSSGVAVTAGKQYWVTADTPAFGTGSDFVGGWNFIYKTLFFGGNQGSGWYSAYGDEEEPAGAVYGTVP